MKLLFASSIVCSLISAASSTSILLPLYIYPSETYGDGAANWQPAFDAMSLYSNVSWLVIVNPDNGPGLTLDPGNDDQNYVDGTAKLNAYNNVETIGYVRTNYTLASMEELKDNITAWQNWSSYTAADIAVKGIFFDEVAHDYEYMREAVSFAQSVFGEDMISVCNFGDAASAKYYDLCTVVVAFESDLNTVGAVQYESQKTIRKNIPQGREAGAAVLITNFTGNAYDGRPANDRLLTSYEDTLVTNGVGWTYACSGGYESITAGPATVARNAAAVAAAS